MKISAAILCRDDSSTLRECLTSIRPHVDELVCVDTGSSDDSPKIARECGADKVDFFVACNDENNQIADFALARNHALSLISNPAHVWLDSDDVITGAEHFRRLLSEKPDVPAVMWLVPYEYQHDPTGRVTVLHHRENLVWPREAFSWQTPVHEVMVPKPGVQAVHIPAPQIRRIHRKQHSTRAPDPQRNLRILRRYVQKSDEGDVRALYYLGVEYSNHGMFGDAITTLRRYVQLSRWPDEKCLATLELARLHQMLGDHETAIHWALQAMTTKSWPEPYWTLAECFYALATSPMARNAEHDFARCAHFAGLGMSLPEAETVLFTNPTKRAEIHRIYSVALFKAGMVDKALASVREGLARLPEDPVLQQNAVYFETITTQQRVMVDLNRLHTIGALPMDRAQAIVNALAGAPAPQLPPAQTAPQLPPPPEQKASEGCLDVVFFVGPGFEPWNPDTLAAGGMGGSETMAWELARRLRKIGHRVRLFGHTGPDAPEGVFEGVEWLSAERYPGTRCDVLISERQPTAVDDPFGVVARLRLLHVHDVHCGPELDQRRSLRFDRVLALSKWHQEFLWQVYPHMDPAKVLVTRNGLDPKRFEVGDRSIPRALSSGPVEPRIVAVDNHPLAPGIPRWELGGARIIIGGGVHGEQDWASLVAMGVTHCICVTDPPDEGVPADRLLCFNVVDDGTPFPFQRLDEVERFARDALSGDGMLYLHCWVGRSRSPSFAYAILRSVYGLGKDAEQYIQQRYPWPEPYGSDPKHRAYIESIDTWIASKPTGAKPARVPTKVVYSSSPDRGLPCLLELWPDVLKEEPDAELHVFYGAANLEKVIAMTGDAELAAMHRRTLAMVKSMPSVTMRGRVNQKQLAEEFLTAGVWVLPGGFTETSCISAAEAQAAGCHVVCSGLAALNETVGERGTLIRGGVMQQSRLPPPQPEEYKREFAAAVVEAIRKARNGQNEAGMKWARESFGLDSLAAEWDGMLRELLAETDRDVVPKYREPRL